MDSLSLGQDETDLLLNRTSSLSLEDDLLSQHTPNHFTKTSIFKHEYTPRTSSPLKSSRLAADTIPHDNDELLEDVGLDDSDVVMEDIENTSFKSKIARRTSLMLSPTMLGAKVATHGSPLSRSPLSHSDGSLLELDGDEDQSAEADVSVSTASPSLTLGSIKNRNKPRSPSSLYKAMSASELGENDEESQTENEEPGVDDYEDSDVSSSSYNSSMSSSTPTKTTLSTKGNRKGNAWPNNSTPIQFQMHHHHYYPSSPQSSFQTDNDSSYYQEDDDSLLLPAPWSKVATPKAPTPYIISSYLQLIFNAFTSSVIIYILISVIRTVKSDINSRMEQYAQDIAMEVSLCARNYVENRCHPETRVAALEELCIGWERCMNRDPSLQASKSSVSAETLGLILNSLIEPIGGKAIVVCSLGIVAWAFTSNFIFGFVRAKSYYGWSNNSNQNNGRNIGNYAGNGPNMLQYQPTPVRSSHGGNNQALTYTPK
jgi:hypothetical protein